MDTVPMARLLVGAGVAMVEEMHRRLAEQGFPELRPTHDFVLNAIGDDGVTTTALASVLGMTKQGAAKVVIGMVELGLVDVTKHPHDARARSVVITARGRDALAAAVSVQRRMESELARSIGRGDVEAARRVLSGAQNRWVATGPALRPMR